MALLPSGLVRWEYVTSSDHLQVVKPTLPPSGLPSPVTQTPYKFGNVRKQHDVMARPTNLLFIHENFQPIGWLLRNPK